MVSPTPLITGSGSQSIENGRKSLGEIHISSDTRFSGQGPSHDRHESERKSTPISGGQDPVSVIETASNRQDEPSNESATTQRNPMSKSRSSQDLEQGIERVRAILGPSVTIIDVDDRGVRTSPWRCWADGPEVERPERDTASPSIRITLVERKPIKKESDKKPERLKREISEDYLGSDGVGKVFCMQRLQALLHGEETGFSFFLQTNVLPLALGWREGTQFQPDSSGIGFGYLFHEFYTKLGFNFSQDLIVGVTCEFPFAHVMISNSRWAGLIPDKLSPLQEAFETMLYSTRSALDLSTGDAILTCQLIVLDLMRSALESWEIFLRQLTMSSPRTRRGGPGSIRVMSLEELEYDVEASTNINSMIRDFAACLAFLIVSIEARLEPKDDARAIRWKFLTTEMKFLSEAVQDMAKDLAETSNRRLASFVAQFGQDQANSAKRLTIVASIFLPLTLSASLMAMTTRVHAIGDLWYDWAGLCFVTGTIVFVVYSNWKIMERLVFRHRDWTRWWVVSMVIRAFPTIWWASTFLAVITSSFVAGMFYTKETAVEILKYGIPVFVGFAFVWFVSKTCFDQGRKLSA